VHNNRAKCGRAEPYAECRFEANVALSGFNSSWKGKGALHGMKLAILHRHAGRLCVSDRLSCSSHWHRGWNICLQTSWMGGLCDCIWWTW